MLQKNPNAGKWKLPEGYTDIGWQKNFKEGSPEKKCFDLGHIDCRTKPHIKHFDNSLYQNRRTDYITICDECKVIWHTDMSD